MAMSRRDRVRAGGASGSTGLRGHVELHIETLVLEDVRSGDRHEVGAAIEQELGVLLTRDAVLSSVRQSATHARLDAGLITASATSRPADLGAAIARSVYRSLSDSRPLR
jgi:hypothetical protein